MIEGAAQETGAPLRIVLETARYVVVDKPAGLLSVPGRSETAKDCAAARVRAMFPRATGPVTVHRLDMDTSGLLLVALDAGAQRDLSMQFERRAVEKAYTALVHGLVPVEAGTISVPVRPDLSNRPYQVIDRSHHLPTITEFRVLAYETDRTRLRLVPLTGRTHQLRVHCAYEGPGGLRGGGGKPRGDGAEGGRGAHPIVGDVLYGTAEDRSGKGAPRLMLHASELSFLDPETGRRVEARSDPEF